MILPVLLYTNKILHKSCEPIIDFQDPKLQELAQDMVETCFAYRGVGLAANQIGKNMQLAILYLENKTKIMVVANPIIKCYTKETRVESEGCLSAPGISINMQRPLGVEFEYFKLNGEKDKMRLEGYDSRIFFHEYSHLQGQMITDSIGKL